MNLREYINEKDRKTIQPVDQYIKNYEKCLVKEEEFLIRIMERKSDDQKHCETLKEKIAQTKIKIEDLESVIVNRRNENQQLEARVNQMEEMLKQKWDDIPRSKHSNNQDAVSNRNENILKATYKTIRHKLKLYKEYLGCTVTYEEPNIFVFTFDNSKGSVKFQFNSKECNGKKWTILDCVPKELLSKDDIEQFESTQNTQELLARLMIK